MAGRRRTQHLAEDGSEEHLLVNATSLGANACLLADGRMPPIQKQQCSLRSKVGARFFGRRHERALHLLESCTLAAVFIMLRQMDENINGEPKKRYFAKTARRRGLYPDRGGTLSTRSHGAGLGDDRPRVGAVDAGRAPLRLSHRRRGGCRAVVATAVEFNG